MDYEKDVTIDETALDVEWLAQPRLMMRYARIAAQARKDMDSEKSNLDIVRAELDKDIRQNPDKYDIAKVTEGAINAAILTDKGYKEVYEKFLISQYELNMAQAAVRAIDGKKDALENLVRLHGQQYFAGPRIPRDLSKEWEQREKQKSSNQKVATTFKRRTK